MALTSKELIDIANDGGFQNRVKYAMQTASLSVMAEAGNVTGHALRVVYAGKVLNGTASVFQQAVGVVTNLTVAAEANLTVTANSGFSVPDSDIQFVVNSNFNAFAGVAN